MFEDDLYLDDFDDMETPFVRIFYLFDFNQPGEFGEEDDKPSASLELASRKKKKFPKKGLKEMFPTEESEAILKKKLDDHFKTISDTTRTQRAFVFIYLTQKTEKIYLLAYGMNQKRKFTSRFLKENISSRLGDMSPENYF